MDLRKRLLAWLGRKAYKPMTPEEIAQEMGLAGAEAESFAELIVELDREADIVRTRYGKIGLPSKMDLVRGRMQMNAKGFGFLIPEQEEGEGKLDDVYVPVGATGGAMNDDRVLVRIQPARGGRRSVEGEVIRIVSRARTEVVGTVEFADHYAFLVPDDRRSCGDILLPKPLPPEIKAGDKVVVEITRWPEDRRGPEGRVLERLGRPDEAGIDVLAILRQHGLREDMPSEVLAEAEQIPLAIKAEEMLGRRDFRKQPIITIDGEDAKDLDDAVYVEELDKGWFRLGVHIADVSWYVRPGSELDGEASRRATSVYLADRVLPMLPPRLSNGICSLNAQEDRLTLSIVMDIDSKGTVRRYELLPGIIHVARRFTYTEVRQLLTGEGAEELASWLPELRKMEALCAILRDRRMRRGAIDFDFPEIKVKLDEAGRPIDVVKRERTIAESIIEEFMLAANEAVAEHMHQLDFPIMFRVHDEPDPEKMIKLDLLLRTFGEALPKADAVKPKVLQKILRRMEGRPEERLISTVMLRSLKQARYEAENRGHFGLAAGFYTHFTSPIRRYPDLVVHRMIRESLKGPLSEQRRQTLAGQLPEAAKHCSERERAAAEAERDSTTLKQVEYMTRFVGEEFDGVISGVTAFGLFVELPNGIEGLVHLSALHDDYYHFDEQRYTLIGSRSGRKFRLGDALRVLVAKTTPADRTIDFVLSDQAGILGRAVPKKGQQERRGDKGKGKGKVVSGAYDRPQLLDDKKPFKKSGKGKGTRKDGKGQGGKGAAPEPHSWSDVRTFVPSWAPAGGGGSGKGKKGKRR